MSVRFFSLFLISALFVSQGCRHVSERQSQRPTHVLQFITGESRVEGEATLFVQNGRARIKVVLPDGEILTSQYAMNDSNQIRFQLARITEGKLAVIQFIGTGETANGHEGAFVGMVDGKLRDDMSGHFILKEKKL